MFNQLRSDNAGATHTTVCALQVGYNIIETPDSEHLCATSLQVVVAVATTDQLEYEVHVVTVEKQRYKQTAAATAACPHLQTLPINILQLGQCSQQHALFRGGIL